MVELILMKVYVFGNQDVPEDNNAIKIVHKFSKEFSEIKFITVPINTDLPFFDEKEVIILDTVSGIKKVKLITNKDFDKLVMSPRNTVHDFDLGFQLKYLQKLGKLKDIKIIGIPQTYKVDYDRIHLILRKLVAQDIHGS
jgi:hypothetical protein